MSGPEVHIDCRCRFAASGLWMSGCAGSLCLSALLMCIAGAALAQRAGTDERHPLVSSIIAAVHGVYECELTILWEHMDRLTGELIVRVHPSGLACDEALRDANRRGKADRIAFARLPRPEDSAGNARVEPAGPPTDGRRPPKNLSLIHEVIE